MRRALARAAAAFIVLNAFLCTCFCLAIPTTWWGKAIACAVFTASSVGAWWTVWYAELQQ